jgi:murein L,D-transpeptidase YcbB/YkuD
MATTYDLSKIGSRERAMMRDEGVSPDNVSNLSPARQKKVPYTSKGLTSLLGMGEASFNPGIGGFTVPQLDSEGKQTGKSVIVANTQDPNFRQTMGHELEHALEIQGGHNIHKEWDRMTEGDTDASRRAVVKRLAQHAPYLQDKWGLDPENAYFTRDMIDYQGGLAKNLLKEQFASLSAIEQANNKRLTDDPYVRKNIFTTPEQRAAYNAVTGLRQTRLDPRDLPAYTPQADKSDPDYDPNPTSMMDKVKSMFGFSKGGSIDKPLKGGSKLI